MEAAAATANRRERESSSGSSDNSRGKATPHSSRHSSRQSKSPQSIVDVKEEPCSANAKHGQQHHSRKVIMGEQGKDGDSRLLARQTPPANDSPIASKFGSCLLSGESPQSTMDEKDEPCSANSRHGQHYQSVRPQYRKSPHNMMMMGKQGQDGHSGFHRRQTPPADYSPVASKGESSQSTMDEKDKLCPASAKHGQHDQSGRHQHEKLPQNMMGEQGQDRHSGLLRGQASPADYSPVVSKAFGLEMSAEEGTEVDAVSTNRIMTPHTCVTHQKDELLSKGKADRNSPQSGQQHVHGSGNESRGNELGHHNCIKPFDICPKKATGPVKLNPSLLAKNKEKRREAERNKMGLQIQELRSGMFLLEAYLSHTEQVEIIQECHRLGLGPGGFYQPGYSDGAKLHLHMMCLGKDWNPETSKYDDRRAIDDAKPPSIPDRFKKMVERALKDSQIFKNQSDDVLPSMEPDICIVNFYTSTGKLGLHQDKDETKESLDAELPVVSFSIGDSAEFLYGDERDVEKAEKVILKSGDVLIFGGKSRHVFHGVPSILQGSAPKLLMDKTDLRPGRLNLTFRQY